MLLKAAHHEAAALKNLDGSHGQKAGIKPAEVSMGRALDAVEAAAEPDLSSEAIPHEGDDVFAEASLEARFGIAAYLNEGLAGFDASIKHRYSDFIVNEIDVQGQVVEVSERLLDASLVKKGKIDDGMGREAENPEEAMGLLRELLGDGCDQTVSQIRELLSSRGDTQILLAATSDKSRRTAIHSFFKDHLNGQLVTDTVNGQIRISYRNKSAPTGGNRKNKRRYDERNDQQPDKPQYLSFVLKKEMMDTMEAISLIARRLHLHSKAFSYAGTKDKRAITTQQIVVRYALPAQIASIAKLSDKLVVSDIRPATAALKLGELSGNRFIIILREIADDKLETVRDNLSAVAKHGFINYYGMQRFGTATSVSTVDIGIALLSRNWRKAIDLILDPRPNDHLAAAARQCWKQTADPAAALALFPHFCIAERHVLRHFVNVGNSKDLLGAIMAINRELRLMYVHSVQSYLWNRLASERITRYGGQIVLGDSIRMGDKVDRVTEDNIATCMLADVVIPLPGHEARPTEGPLRELFDSVMAELGLDPAACFHAPHKSLWDLPGAYRSLIVMPSNLCYFITSYSAADEIIDSDNAHEGGDKKAAVIKISLPTSAYATMALHEIMHVSGSTRHRKSIPNK